ncbi:MAG: purine-nucleoside phosphorylase, partial [Eubacterium sp.]|nr:purine-nucleoside phosphorylase [Eubacterium sp.]
MLNEQIEFIRTRTDFMPKIALVLGSGLGELADEIDICCTVDYKDIPDFPISTAPSHKGRFVFGKIENKNVVIMQGRIHLYEGYSA